MPTIPRSLSTALALLAAACGPRPGLPMPERGAVSVTVAESAFGVVRDLRDRLDVGRAAGSDTTPDGVRLERLARTYDSVRTGLPVLLAAVDSGRLAPEDARALGVMRRAQRRDLGPLIPPAAVSLGPDTPDSLRARIYAAYGQAQSHVSVGADTLDRLSILAALGRTEEAKRRRELFLALTPVWKSINGENTAGSPYRRLIALEAAARGGTGSRPGAASPGGEQALLAGMVPDSLERWLLAVLETWRDATPDSLVEPWDWYYRTGRTSRTLGSRVPRERLAELNARVWAGLGVDVHALHVHYDLDPREGKDPVAFTTFGAREPRIEPWVFATYRTGGLDNLNELLHETGHAAHIAAIRTRPAFRDWPDSDAFTEALADVVALDVYEPAWQQRWLGDSVPLADGLRGRYGGIVMDVAWALFEARMLREPTVDPNAVWTVLTRDYLHIRAHPGLSWWAMRGQLVDAPGYMMNYAAGSILVAGMRARIRALHGPFDAGDSTWYAWVAPRLYRFGLERPSREVIEEFLGGPVRPEALLADLRRMRVP